MMQQDIFHAILSKTSVVWDYRRKALSQHCHWHPADAQARSHAKRLVSHGLVTPYTHDITPSGWEKLGINPADVAIAQLEKDIAIQCANAADNVRGKMSEWNLSYLRDLYHEPEMDTARGESIERERVFQNALLYAETLAWQEHTLAALELYASRRRVSNG